MFCCEKNTMVCHAGHLPSRTGCEESAGPTRRGISFIPMHYVIRMAKKRKVRELVPVVHNLIFIHITQTDMKELKKRYSLSSVYD